jgi:Flp pilus assembly pilin Flp
MFYKGMAFVIGRVAALKDEEGQTTVEYAVVLALVIALAIAAFTVLGGSINGVMTKIGDAISNQIK